MDEETWNNVDDYFSLLAHEDDALRQAVASSRSAGLPDIQVTPTQGKLLQILALCVGARRILEVGTLGGYSTIWMARALPAGGRLITLELEDAHATVARENLSRARLDDLVEVRSGDAKESMRALVEDGAEPFDLIFIDADKQSNPVYFQHALRLAHFGTLIIVDNVVRGGAVADAASDDDRVRATRELLEQASIDPRIDATAIQTVGAKGYDGFAIFRLR
ncbi:MAG TPA: O-methyltransferase [Acidimicrobiales bacterium]|nr:O-methyltransferase [Acidimicrobiales bacterium]